MKIVSADMSAADQLEFERWRDASPRHREAYNEVRDLWEEVEGQRLDGQRGSAPAARTARRALPVQVPARTPASRAVRLGRAAGLAAGVLLLAFLAADLPTRLRADHWTAVGQQATVPLPDGSTVHLNTDTAIAIDASVGGRRVRLLRGEALFEVASDESRPFSVRALTGHTTAIGTAFAVRAADAAVTVTVLEGVVHVSAPDTPESQVATGAGVIVRAGERVSYTGALPPGALARVDLEAATAWRHGAIELEALPLAQSLAEIDRYRPGKILLLAETAAREPVTARIPLDALDAGIESIAASHGLAITRLTDALLILR